MKSNKTKPVNKAAGEYEITLKGAPFVVKYTMNSIAALDEIFGSHAKLFTSDVPPGPRATRGLVYAGLLHDKKLARGLTLEKAGNVLDVRDYMAVYWQCLRALFHALGEDPALVDDIVAEMDADEDDVAEADESTGKPPPVPVAPHPAAASIGTS